LPRSVYPSASLAQRLDLDALYAQAAMEGEVSAYLQGPPQVYAGFVREFEAKYPKVKVRITPGRYDLMPKIDAQIAAGRMDADLAILQTRKRADEPFVMLPRSLLESYAWRALSRAARQVIDRIVIEHLAHGGRENGK